MEVSGTSDLGSIPSEATIQVNQIIVNQVFTDWMKSTKEIIIIIILLIATISLFVHHFGHKVPPAAQLEDWNKLGDKASHNHKYLESIQYYTKAIELDSTNEEAY